MKTSDFTINLQQMEEWILRSRRITLLGLQTPLACVEIKTNPTLYGSVDNQGKVKYYAIDHLATIGEFARKHGKPIYLNQREVAELDKTIATALTR